MRYLSVCSGIEAATVAWHPLGWEAAGFSEIDKFPSAVLVHHYPDVPNFGDFTTIKAEDVGAIDILVGGTPCQDFSIAGLRAGMAGDRGNLTLEFLRLVERLRPRWVVWENVPGVLSSNDGRDFGAFLGGLVELGHGFAYRVLDAQYFGLAQRRKRVFVVGYLGDWRRAAAVLFERDSLSWNPSPRSQTWKEIAGTLGSRSTAGGGLGTDFDLDGGVVSHALMARTNDGKDPSMQTYVTHALRAEGFDASEDGTGRGTPIIPIQSVQAVREKRQNGIGIGHGGDAMFTLTGRDRHAVAFSCKDHGADAGDIAPTLRAMEHSGSHANAGGQVAIAYRTTGNDGCYELGDLAGCLSTATDPNAQVLSVSLRGREGGATAELGGDTMPALRTGGGGGDKPHALNGSAVRRLTPRECERLQGFPDDYTLVPYRGKSASDGPRYRALGNSMAVPVMSWMLVGSGDGYLTDAPFDEAEIEPWAWDDGMHDSVMTDEEIMRVVWLDRMERAGIVQRVQPTPMPTPAPYVKKPIPTQLRWAVFRRDEYRCVKCGSDEDLTADHIHAEVHGGKATIGNLQTLCRPCNSKKGAR